MPDRVPAPARRAGAAPAPLALAPLLLLAACASAPGSRDGATKGAGLPSVEARTAGLVSVPGLLPMHWDGAAERLYLEPPPDGVPLLWTVALRTGLGSNDVGLDRGQLGESRLVEFETVGRRALLVAPNLDWRSSSGDEHERRGVEESFASSVVAALDVVARTGERRLLDATGLFLADRHRIAARLEDAGQGSFALDLERSALLIEELRGFPDNSEVEVLLTFAGDRPGPEVRATAADPRAPSFRVHHSFVRLPDPPTFPPRAFHPRCGYFPLLFRDADSDIDEPLERRWILRHRLERDASGGVREPIVYHVDPAAPEPVRTALLEGARYWEPVFERAGFPGGFRVELLPEDADPLDVRYHVIQWVNRSTRGWSYGDSVADPRTGEILKGHVTLGALRVRQDVLLAEGLLSPYEDERPDPRVEAMALARIRQLAAHEVGHTLGLAHNFAASVDGRASVMDYPAPRVLLDAAGGLDLSDAYRDGCGEWDELAVRYGYGVWPDEAAGLAATLEEMAGWHYLTDADARGDDRSHPLANLWDDGDDPVAALARTVEVRRVALERFSEGALRPGRPLAQLEEVLVPVYFHHRFQLEAAAKVLGGVRYDYPVRGEERTRVAPGTVPPEDQARALDALLATLAPAFLDLPERLWEPAAIPPRPPGWPATRELFDPGALHFDPLGAAAAAADRTLELLLEPARAARVLDQGRLDPDQPGLDGVLDALLDRAWPTGPAAAEPPRRAALRDEVRVLVVEHLLALAADGRAPVRVRAAVRARLPALERRLGADAEDPVAAWALDRLAHFLADPREARGFDREHALPPGAPIGAGPALPGLADCAAADAAPFPAPALRGR